MKFLSLFSGIGGLDLGLERAGMTCIAQVEKNEFCRRVLAKHWPNVPRFGDVEKFCRRVGDCEGPDDYGEAWCPRCEAVFSECDCVGADQFTDKFGYPDIVCGGFPCQDVSNAGKREGIDGERSGLWREFRRIVCELRPRFIVVENVGGLTVRGFQRVLGDLCESGYDAEWSMLQAAALGAIHRRDRLFIVANAVGDGLEGRHAAKSVGQVAASALDNLHDWPAISEPFGIRTHDGIPDFMDRINALGNAVVPQCAELIGRAISLGETR